MSEKHFLYYNTDYPSGKLHGSASHNIAEAAHENENPRLAVPSCHVYDDL